MQKITRRFFLIALSTLTPLLSHAALAPLKEVMIVRINAQITTINSEPDCSPLISPRSRLAGSFTLNKQPSGQYQTQGILNYAEFELAQKVMCQGEETGFIACGLKSKSAVPAQAKFSLSLNPLKLEMQFSEARESFTYSCQTQAGSEELPFWEIPFWLGGFSFLHQTESLPSPDDSTSKFLIQDWQMITTNPNTGAFLARKTYEARDNDNDTQYLEKSTLEVERKFISSSH